MKSSLVLGIDAAWTSTHPSGIALVSGKAKEKNWKLISACSNYSSFLKFDGTGNRLIADASKRDNKADPAALLAQCKRLGGDLEVEVVSVDMPLSTDLITKRRMADSKVSREYGDRWCAVHNPSEKRPGPISVSLTKSLEEQSFPLMVSERIPPRIPALIEVYPHVALLTLIPSLKVRLEYKASRSSKYWPGLVVAERYDKIASNLLEAWSALGRYIDLPALPIPSEPKMLARLKAYEDLLDGVICAWMGIKYLAGEAKPMGDDEGAIWVPK